MFTILPVEKPARLPVIRELAEKIWPAAYAGILSPEQIDYMIHQMMYSDEVMNREFAEGVVFEILCDDGRPIGFVSYGPCHGDTAKLHKLYLLPEYHGRRLGTILLRHVAEQTARAGCRTLVLNVNKHNARAIKAYRRNGFTLDRAEKNDIGGGFCMDDYVLSKALR